VIAPANWVPRRSLNRSTPRTMCRIPGRAIRAFSHDFTPEPAEWWAPSTGPGLSVIRCSSPTCCAPTKRDQSLIIAVAAALTGSAAKPQTRVSTPPRWQLTSGGGGQV